MKIKWGPNEAAYTAMAFFGIALIASAMKVATWLRVAYILWFKV